MNEPTKIVGTPIVAKDMAFGDLIYAHIGDETNATSYMGAYVGRLRPDGHGEDTTPGAVLLMNQDDMLDKLGGKHGEVRVAWMWCDSENQMGWNFNWMGRVYTP